MSLISVAFVDDHPLMIEAVTSLFSRTHGIRLIATGSAAKDVVEICLRYQPQVMVIDLSLPGDAFEAIAAAKTSAPNTKLIAFTAASGVETAVRALDAGASGYVLKGSNSGELIQAIRSVEAGETYITQNFASKVITALRDTSLRKRAAEAVKLSIREQQIMRLLLNGKTNREIAVAIKISEKTVKHYMTILMHKLQVRNRLEVVIAAQNMNSRSAQVSLHS